MRPCGIKIKSRCAMWITARPRPERSKASQLKTRGVSQTSYERTSERTREADAAHAAGVCRATHQAAREPRRARALGRVSHSLPREPEHHLVLDGDQKE